VLARALEDEGIATTSISMVREHTAQVKPPRALFVPFPFGHALGAPPAPVQASAITPVASLQADPVVEAKDMRALHERWMVASGGRTAFGLAGLPAERFTDVVAFLQRFADGADADMPERPAHLPRPDFIRYCADDLKALFFEGRLASRPDASGEAVARWFWAETAVGQVLRRVRDRLDASDNPRDKAAAFGVAR
jgi:hypothetical protein